MTGNNTPSPADVARARTAAARRDAEARAVAGDATALPDVLATAAEAASLDLAGEAGALVLAAGTAASVRADTALETQLSHQAAAAHALAMRMMAAAREELAAYAATGHRHPHRSQEAARMAGAASRLLDAAQRAALTLDRLRTGGRQVVTVQHITVTEGGQAVVAAGDIARGRGQGARPE